MVVYLIMFDNRPWKELNDEIAKLSEEYARLKNRPKPFETETEKEVREDQFRKDRHEKWAEFDSFKADFEKKREYILKLKQEIENKS